MQLATVPIVAGARFLLNVVSPLQKIIDRPGITHEFCNRQALLILRADGFVDCADFLETYMTELNAGVYWADRGWKNANHYFEPGSGRGLWKFKTALDDFQAYIFLAARWCEYRNYRRTAFFLGAAAHLVQDLCVPHHARGKLFSGHKQYEHWVENNIYRFRIHQCGRYSEAIPLTGWLSHNALIAADMLDFVTEQEESSYHAATHILLPLAQCSTAGMFWQFYYAVIAKQVLLYKDVKPA